MLASCEFPGCNGAIIMKVIDDKIMFKPLKIPHLAACQMTKAHRAKNDDGSSRDSHVLVKSMGNLHV